jgi:RHS repeat-associated protein
VKTLTNKKGTSTVSRFTYTYNLDGNQASKTDSTGRVTTYLYDGLGRLTNETETVGNDESSKTYSYDSAGNRETMTVTGTENYTTSYDYDLNNRLKTKIKDKIVTVETAEYRYDKNGNQISKTTFTTGNTGGGEAVGIYLLGSNRPVPREDYTVEINKFDGFNRLVQVQNDEGTGVYLYKADGLRHSKEVNGELSVQVWDGSNVILEYGAVNDVYLRGINLIKSNNQGYYLFNAHGDVVQRADGGGAVTKAYVYDAFGVESDIDELDTNPFRYCAEYFDQETGSIYLRARYYDPSVGGFMSEDPIRDSLNWYTYCMGNPLLFFDPSGLDALSTDPLNPYKINPSSTSTEVISDIYYRQTNGWTPNASVASAPNISYIEIDDLHELLDALGMIPGLDIIFDSFNGLVYLFEGDRSNMMISMISVLPAGDAAKAGRIISTSSEILSETLEATAKYGNGLVDDAMGAGSEIKNIYPSIKNAPNYPQGFQKVTNGTKKVTVNNGELLDQLRQIEPGEWKKVYQDGYVDGQRTSIHYFQHTKTGKVFDVEPHFGKWSNSSSR